MPKKELEALTIPLIKEHMAATFLDNDCLIINAFQKLNPISKPYKAGFIVFTLCIQGESSFALDAFRYSLKANDILIIKEGETFSDFKPSADYQGYSIIMSSNFFDEIIKDMPEFSFLFRLSGDHSLFSLQPFESRAIIAYSQLIETKMHQTGHRYLKETIGSLIKTMIYDISEAFHRVQKPLPSRRTRSEIIFEDFIHLVETHFKQERRVSWYSEKLFITPKYLAEAVKKVSKRTPNEWIIQYITWELRVQLRNSRKNIKEIAKELNFPNQSLLGKFFKDQTGMSPSEYRKN